MTPSPLHKQHKYSNSPRSSISPSPGHSPKRKRENIDVSPLRIDTSSSHDNGQPSGMESPRTKVAENFKELQIQQPKRSPFRDQLLPRKRLKRNPKVVDTRVGDVSTIEETPGLSTQFASEHFDDLDGPGEVGETPNCHTKTRLWSPVSASAASGFDLSREPSQTPDEIDEHPYGVPSAPPPTPAKSTLVIEINRSVSPLPLREELTSDQAALTWQEDEITGHDIDQAGGDDGEGINGIGFRPTPAMAYARQQRRKQQVSEWKAREAREARQKRIEKRRGERHGVGGFDTGVGLDKRAVRFAGVEF